MESGTFGIRVLCPGADDEYLADLVLNLRESVLDTKVDDVRAATTGPAPEGAKSGEALAIGALVVTLAPTVAESLLAIVSSWLSRQPDDIEIEVDGHRFRGRVTRAQREALVAGFLRRLDRDS